MISLKIRGKGMNFNYNVAQCSVLSYLKTEN